jgi:hypothetical protein
MRPLQRSWCPWHRGLTARACRGDRDHMTTAKPKNRATKAARREASAGLGVDFTHVDTLVRSAVARNRTRRELRLALGLPLIQIAARAGVSESTARLFEADPSAVTNTEKRAALAAVYAQLEADGIPSKRKAG